MDDYTGQVGIVTQAKKWSVGWWVEKVTRSPAHHVVVGIGNGQCVSAEPEHVRYRNITEYGDRIIWTRYTYTTVQARTIAWFADGHVGIDYNLQAFTALGVHYLLHLPIPKWLVNHLDSRDHVTCSQLAADILRATNITPIPQSHVPSPADWYNIAKQQGWVTHT